MKSLKLDHNIAELVLQGAQTSTWRLYDDKDLSVNDTVQLIDKVDPANPGSWQPIGIAHIDTVIQKRLGDLTPDDYDGRELFSSKQELLETYRRYYGPQVDWSTPLKIIRFTFNNSRDNQTLIDDKSTSNLTDIKMYADGGSRGNPGPSASGFALLNQDGKVVVKKGVYLGITTNNQAEYQALKLGLEECLKVGAQTVHVYMDSLLVVNQMLGIFKVKNRDLWPIHTATKELLQKFKHVSFTHVPRELNKVADAAVNEALDAAEAHP